MKNKSSSLKIGIGTPTILMIFVVLCMVILSVLSYMEANTNQKLTNKELDYTQNYYQAKTKAELVYHTLNKEGEQANQSLNDIKKLYDVDVKENDKQFEYYVTIDDKKQIHVIVDKTSAEIYSFKVETKEGMK